MEHSINGFGNESPERNNRFGFSLWSHSMKKKMNQAHLTTIESLKWPGFVEFDDVNGKVLTFTAQDNDHVPLKIFSIEDAVVLGSFNHLLHRHKKVDFNEQFNEKIPTDS